METAKANRLSPFDYIEYILEIMPQIDIIQHPEKIDWFMPWSDQIKEEFGIKDD
ncbi:transposase domain-containing protein [Catenibacterium mitsuokai]|uniref:transposase domain-containing protein n=1 Tax=Catenibacterium mitsuokai TaxID=100886 RepID=UPI002E2204C9